MMNKPRKQGVAEELEGLLLKINRGGDVGNLQKQANQLISAITPSDITRVEERLVQGGLSSKRVQQLSASFLLMGLMEGKHSNFRERLEGNHILKKVLAEHDMMLCFLADLEEVAQRINQSDFLNDTSGEIRRLAHIADHVRAMEEHLGREDDIIFPALRSQGWGNLCKSVETEHASINLGIHELVSLVNNFGSISFGLFKVRLLSVVKTLCPIFKEHIFYENHILYPIVVVMIDTPTFWSKMREVCDEIDYCGIHL
jgi:DUF438 domain-containing protein